VRPAVRGRASRSRRPADLPRAGLAWHTRARACCGDDDASSGCGRPRPKEFSRAVARVHERQDDPIGRQDDQGAGVNGE
jgi:hypothetical protein